MKKEETPKREKLLTIKEMAALLQVSERNIVEWIQYRRIPFVKVNNELIRFRVSDIAKWVQDIQKKRRPEKQLIH